MSFRRCIVPRPGGALKGRFSWIPAGIPNAKVDTRNGRKKTGKGLDGLGQDVIGPVSAVLLPTFACLFTLFLTFAVAPRDWSLAMIVLVKKNGSSRSDLDNFRAVPLLYLIMLHI